MSTGTASSGFFLGAIERLSAVRARRVPAVLQQDPSECGAASLAMILAFHGRATSLAECRELCGSGRDGASAQAIARAARNQGLRVRAFSLQSCDLSAVPRPAIVHWNFNHFLVVEHWTPKSVDVVDPAQGRRRLTPAEFEAGFTGVVLTFEPGAHFETRARGRSFRWSLYVADLVRASRIGGPISQVLLASLLLQVLGLALPVFTKIVVDEILPAGLSSVLPMLALGAGILVLAQVSTSWLRSMLLLLVRSRLDARMMLGFFEHLLSLPFAFFQTRTSGDLLMRLSSNAMLRELLTGQTISVLFDGALVVVYLVILCAWQPIFGAIVLAIGVLQVAVLLATNRMLFRLMQRDLQSQADAQGYVVEALNGMTTLKASGTEHRALERWTSLFFGQLDASVQRSRASTLVETAMMSLRVASPIALLLIGAAFVLDGRMSLGSMLALNALAASFLSPLSSLVGSGQSMQLVGAHMDRIADVLETDPEQDGSRVRSVSDVRGRLEMRGVSFRYSANAALALEDVSLSIEPGQKVAIVGRTGSGKSTLGKLLLGLYRPEQGVVLCDGVPLDELDLRGLRSRFGVVLQESFLFSGSIRSNIALSNPALSLSEIAESARKAAIHDEIECMPMGYETMLAEGGAGLSGGQRQRLSIARALANEPAVLLLDEATSHLDVLTESVVDANLARLECTRIVIAHRLSTLRGADCIFVMEAGRIVERGTHEELFTKGGVYAELVRGQLGA